MNRLEAEVSRLREFGATTGQIEHHLISLGLREDDEPSADGRWWWWHRETNPNCCGPNYPDGHPPKQERLIALPEGEKR